jgi:hypothetical protein
MTPNLTTSFYIFKQSLQTLHIQYKEQKRHYILSSGALALTCLCTLISIDKLDVGFQWIGAYLSLFLLYRTWDISKITKELSLFFKDSAPLAVYYYLCAKDDLSPMEKHQSLLFFRELFNDDFEKYLHNKSEFLLWRSTNFPLEGDEYIPLPPTEGQKQLKDFK